MTKENTREATRVDVYVGKAIKSARVLQNVSQEKLAEELGVSFQQVQKYERGFNRVSASRLADIAAALGRPVQEFFPERYREAVAS